MALCLGGSKVNLKALGVLLCTTTASAVLSLPAQSQDSPPLPSGFYGSVSPASAVPAGTRVTAWLNGGPFAEGEAFVSAEGVVYALNVPSDIAATAGVEGGIAGQMIEFRVGGAAVTESGSFEVGGDSRLNLTATLGPDLEIAIDDGVLLAYPGARLLYTIVVTNRGAQQTTGIALRDPLPVATTLVSLGGGVLENGAVVWPALDLAPGASATRYVELEVESVFPAGMETLINTASVSHDGAQGLDPDPANNSAADADEFIAPPDFAVATTDLVITPASPQVGQTASAALTVRNAGFQAGTAVVMFYDGRPGGGRVVGSTLATLEPQAAQTVSVGFTVEAATALVSAVVDPDDQVRELSETNNSAEQFLRQAADPAIGVDNFLLAPAEPQSGSVVGVSMTVRNGGQLPAENVLVELYDGDPQDSGVLVSSQTVALVPAGGNRTVTATWTAVEGLRQLVVVLDPLNQIQELSETNNRAEQRLDVRRSSGPDLVVASVDLSSLTQSATNLVADGTLRAKLGNLGTAAAAGPFAVRLFEDRNGDGVLSQGESELGRAIIADGLAAAGSVTVTIPLHATLEFLHPLLWVEVDSEDEVAELSESNNLSTCFGICEIPASSGSLLPVTEKWFLPGLEIESAPVVVQLSDDNGDGVVSGADVADVVFHTEDVQGRAVTARNGLDGGALWTFRDSIGLPVAGRLAHLAAGDLDGDGVAEIVAVSHGRLFALDARGQLRWVSDPIEGPLANEWAGSVALGDMDADGVPEIAVGRTVLTNAGHRIAQGAAKMGQNTNYYGPFGVPVPPGIYHQHSILADLDLDGRAELVAGATVYRLVGGQLQIVWDYVAPDNLMRDGLSAVANLDGDPQPEIVYVSSGFAVVLNHDGTVAAGYKRIQPLVPPLTDVTYWAGAPSIADLDGDGSPEILVSTHLELYALRANLSPLWRRATTEFSELSVATAFDLDGDGAAEVLGLDHESLFILDGRNGQTLYSQANTSKTACEGPVVADLDNDGRAEILVPSNRSFDNSTATQGLHVLGNPTWRPTRPIWNQYSYHVTNVQLDGTIPSPEAPSWLSPNQFRVNTQSSVEPQRLANLTVSAPRVGTADSAGVPVTLRVGNGGLQTVPPGVGVRLYAGSPSETNLAGEGVTDRPLQPGEWLDLLVYWQRPGGPGVAGLAIVDPDSRIEECQEGDNGLDFTVAQSVLPDLAIPPAGVSLPANPVAGQRVPLSVRVENHGSASAGASVVRVFERTAERWPASRRRAGGGARSGTEYNRGAGMGRGQHERPPRALRSRRRLAAPPRARRDE